jgi:hypothetical protein
MERPRARRLSPPGPLAPRRQKPLGGLGWPRAIVLAVLIAVGAYLLVTLGGGDQPASSTQNAPSLNGSDVPITPGSQAKPQGRTPR